ncbi:hypothetical protein [Tistrella mobilis]|uniref:hypothetical protein n=1 Tax=Tistrella mobilis TaxID=171437 RepID=UPI0035568F3E
MADDALQGRQSFKNALLILAEASRKLEAQGVARPILVGGAAVEFYTAARFISGDFDIVTPSQDKLEAVLRELGFETPRDGTRGLQNYALNIGIEVVGSRLLDGMGSIDHVSRIEFEPGFYVDFIGVEDLIADRVAQADATSRLDRDRLEQAIVLFKMLVDRIDRPYLSHQIEQQAPGRSLEWFEVEVDAFPGKI